MSDKTPGTRYGGDGELLEDRSPHIPAPLITA